MTSRQKINILTTTTCFLLFVHSALALEISHLLDEKTFTGFDGGLA